MRDPRDDKYWKRARFRVYYPDGPPLRWYQKIPWWMWPLTVLTILGTATWVLLILKGV